MPLHFRPVPGSGIPYSSVIVEITPDEFDRIRLQELKLPDGWTIDDEYPRGTACGRRHGCYSVGQKPEMIQVCSVIPASCLRGASHQGTQA